METINELEDKLSEPSQELVNYMRKLDGDIIILGVGGKMGPSLARLSKNAIDFAGVSKKVIGVSRFSSKEAKKSLEDHGVEAIPCDLLNEQQLRRLPDVKNVIFMAGTKFGTAGNENFTWAMNSYLPGQIAQKYRNSRIVSFSTGNVYPLTPVKAGGASEEHLPSPIGEYAQSCLGRERVFEYFSRMHRIPMVHFRLNYAIDLRYGVLLEIAKSVKGKKPIDLQMGHVNVIWQGDANEMAIRSLTLGDYPPNVLNITGPETVSIRWLAQRFAEKFGEDPLFVNKEDDTALLSNASKAHQLFGYPKVSLREMIDWTANWVQADGQTINKPTHFQERQGAF